MHWDNTAEPRECIGNSSWYCTCMPETQYSQLPSLPSVKEKILLVSRNWKVAWLVSTFQVYNNVYHHMYIQICCTNANINECYTYMYLNNIHACYHNNTHLCIDLLVTHLHRHPLFE